MIDFDQPPDPPPGSITKFIEWIITGIALLGIALFLLNIPFYFYLDYTESRKRAEEIFNSPSLSPSEERDAVRNYDASHDIDEIETKIAKAAKECVRQAEKSRTIYRFNTSQCFGNEVAALYEAKRAVCTLVDGQLDRDAKVRRFIAPLVEDRMGVLASTQECCRIRKDCTTKTRKTKEEVNPDSPCYVNEAWKIKHAIPGRALLDNCDAWTFLSKSKIKKNLPTLVQRWFGDNNKRLDLALIRR